MRLNKKYTLSQLKELHTKGAIITLDYMNNTHGTGGAGYYERRGIKINGVPYQVVYSSQGYANTITSDIVEYNGNMLPKHFNYSQDVLYHFNKYIKVLINE